MKRMVRAALVGAVAWALPACTQQQALPEALDGEWRVQQIAGASLGENVRIVMRIDAATGRVTGFTGCNDFAASGTAFGEAITFGGINESDGDCASAAAATDEARFLAVLPSVQRYGRRGRSLELLPTGAGEALLRLRLENGPESAD